MSIGEIIKRRSSWRTYNKKPLGIDDLQLLKEQIASNLETPFGNIPRIMIIEKKPESKQLGTYGFIQGARNYIIGAISDGNMAVEDFGYAFEHIILKATELGLGTCWLGGTFNRSSFRKLISLGETELMPAISPVGYVKDDRSLMERVMCWAIKAKMRKSWGVLFFDSNLMSLAKDSAGVFSDAFENVRLGPSASNGQPWRLIVDEEKVHFYAMTNVYSRMQRLDMGIAFCHFELTLKEKGVSGKWRVSDPNLNDSWHYVATWSALNLARALD